MPGWRTVNVDCSDEDFKKENGYGRVVIRAISDGENIMVDDLNVNDAIDYNVVTTISAPLHVQGGESADVTINVRNVGPENAEGFSVKLHTSDGKTMTTESGTIAPGDSRTMCSLTPYLSTARTSRFGARLSGPTTRTRRTTSLQSTPSRWSPLPILVSMTSRLPRPTTESSSTGLLPAVDNLTIMESFETYAPFLTDDVDPWTLYDADGERTYTFGGISFPGNGTPFAYTVFNCDGTTHGMGEDETQQFKDRFDGRTGNQALMSFGTLGSSEHGNNDWLISPELSARHRPSASTRRLRSVTTPTMAPRTSMSPTLRRTRLPTTSRRFTTRRLPKTSNGQSTQSICPRVLSTSLSFAPLRCL